ncbi:TonB-dependent receptor [Nibricoccus sp. IMCC34717]|uniref:TonB-dependent receptor n=1 Tax=Nibricoccus sp. IMCC34717 TaxID=3034021 RepID=UPI00384DF094
MRHALLSSVSLLAASGVFAAGDGDVVSIPPIQVLDSRPAGAFAAASRSELTPADVARPPLEAAALAPNLAYSSAGTNAFGSVLSVRGLSNTPYFGEPALAWYVDDLPLGGTAATPALIPGLESVLWVRGPQAAFSFGRSGPAGTARLQTLSAGTTPGSLRIAYGSRNAAQADARLQVRSGALDVRAAFAYAREDGYVQNNTLGRTVGDSDHRGVNARLRWQLSPNADVSLQVLGTQARDGAQPLVPLATGGLTVDRPSEGTSDADFGGAVLSARVTGAYGALSSHTSVIDWQLSPYRNTLALPAVLTSELRQNQRALAQEFRWQSPASADYPSAAGLWWSDGKTEGQVERSLFGTIPLEASSHQLRRRQWAAYAQSVLMSDEGWTLEGALRVERHRTEFGRLQDIPTPDGYRLARTKTRWVPKLAATVPLSARSRLLLIASEAYKPEGYSAYTDSKRLSAFNAERTRAAEAWWEWTPDPRVSVVARAFRYDIRNYQVERSFTATDYLVVNAPRARSRGYEVEATVRLTTVALLRGSVGWQNVRLRHFTDPFSGVTFDGRRAPYAPAFTSRLQFDWEPLAGLVFSADVRRVGSTYYTEAEDPLYLQRGYTLTGASLSWERGRWIFSVRGRNLTDERYRTLLVPGIDHAVPGEPRTWLTEIRYRW